MPDHQSVVVVVDEIVVGWKKKKRKMKKKTYMCISAPHYHLRYYAIYFDVGTKKCFSFISSPASHALRHHVKLYNTYGGTLAEVTGTSYVYT